MIPQPAFHKRVEEVAFFERFFQGVSVWADETVWLKRRFVKPRPTASMPLTRFT